MPVTVRPARPDDVEALLRVKARSWREAYGALLPPAYLDDRDAAVPAQVPAWTALIGSDHELWVADDDGRLLGVALAGPRRPAEETGRAGAQDAAASSDGLPDLELMVLYILADAYGTGLGARLLSAVVGNRPAMLRVLAEIPRAMAFYAKHGFVAEGEPEAMTGPWAGLHEQLMVRCRPGDSASGRRRFSSENAPGSRRFSSESGGA